MKRLLALMLVLALALGMISGACADNFLLDGDDAEYADAPILDGTSDPAHPADGTGATTHSYTPDGSRSIEIYVQGNPKDIKVGDTITLKAKLTGYKGLKYSIQWQRFINNKWVNVKGQGDSLKLKVTDDMDNSVWQVVVTLK